MKRGEIYYISRDYREVDTEERGGRPAVILSCDKTNEGGYIANVVKLTTAPWEENNSFHPVVTCAGRKSFAICEQVTTVAASRIGNFICKCDPDEFVAIEAAVSTALGLDAVFTRPEKPEPIEYDETDELLVASLTAERDTYKNCFEQIVNKLTR